MSPEAMGILGFFVVFLLIALRIPLGIAFAAVGSVGLIILTGVGPAFYRIGVVPFAWGTSFTLITVPLFLLMGHLAFSAQITTDLFQACQKWVGQLRGGLGVATLLASAAFAAICGSSVASSAAITNVALPEMRKHGYHDRLSTGLIATGGTLAILIPPSVGFIIYGTLTEQSVGKLFIAGILPGVLVLALYIVALYVTVRIKPEMAPAASVSSWTERFSSARRIWAMALLFLLVMGGIYLGIFSPTEAAAVGACGALILAVIRRSLTRKGLNSAVLDTMRSTTSIFLVIIGAMIFNYFLATSGVASNLAMWISGLQISQYVILAGIVVMYLILGCVMELIGMLVLTLPFIFPTIVSLGFSPIWFGVVIVRLMEIALVTPPLGMNVFVVAGVSRVPAPEIFRGTFPFTIADFFSIVLLVAFPQIALFLPGLMK